MRIPITKTAVLAAFALAALAGCGGKVRQVQMVDAAGAPKAVEFPAGTVTGGASQQQAGALAQMVADSNAAAAQRADAQARTATATAEAVGRVEADVNKIDAGVQELQAGQKRAEEAGKRVEAGDKKLEQAIEEVDTKVEAGVKKLAEGEARIEEGVRKNGETGAQTLETAKKTWDTTRMIIEAFEKTARRQGTGEVTAFFETSSSRIAKGSLQERRIIEFVDWLARESRGRKIMFVSVGSASATGPKALNERLAKERSEALLAVVDQYLVNVPHEYVKIYGTGDSYSPAGLKAAENLRYQHARLIAYYEKDQEPALPEPR
jgi:hypothetical protein